MCGICAEKAGLCGICADFWKNRGKAHIGGLGMRMPKRQARRRQKHYGGERTGAVQDAIADLAAWAYYQGSLQKSASSRRRLRLRRFDGASHPTKIAFLSPFCGGGRGKGEDGGWCGIREVRCWWESHDPRAGKNRLLDRSKKPVKPFNAYCRLIRIQNAALCRGAATGYGDEQPDDARWHLKKSWLAPLTPTLSPGGGEGETAQIISVRWWRAGFWRRA